MSVDSLTYLLGLYWPFLTVAVVIGLVAGWFSGAPAKAKGDTP